MSHVRKIQTAVTKTEASLDVCLLLVISCTPGKERSYSKSLVGFDRRCNWPTAATCSSVSERCELGLGSAISCLVSGLTGAKHSDQVQAKLLQDSPVYKRKECFYNFTE